MNGRMVIPVVVGVACFWINFAVLSYLFANFEWTIRAVFGRGSWWVYQPLAVKAIYVAGIAPIIEELIHRRLILQAFINKSLPRLGLVVSSATFGVYHMVFGWGWLKAVDMFFVGIVFGLVYLKYKLTGSWLCHLSNNLMSVLMMLS